MLSLEARAEVKRGAPQWRRLARKLVRFVGWGALACVLLLLAGWLGLRLVPLPPALFAAQPPEWEFLDRNGQPLRSVRPDNQPFRRTVEYGEIPQPLIQATLAAEDRRFWRHPGVDWRANLRAAWQLARHRRILSGGSTITQQLIKLAQPRPRTFRTKLIEAIQALRLERVWDKQRILAAYMNRLDYGNANRGCAVAAQFYFAKSLGDLSPAECALLAGLPQAPSRLNPRSHLDRAVSRQQWILGQMRLAGWLTEEQFQRAIREPLRLAAARRSFEAPHFIDLVLALGQRPEAPHGLGVRTTLDLALNRFAESALRQHISRLRAQHVSNGAIVVLDNRTGDVLALVGSENYFAPAAGQVNGAWAPRSPGSTLKPFTYLLALERGATPATVVADVPTEFATATGVFTPVNYNRHCYGPMRYRLALANSLNISAVKVLASIGGPEPLQRLLQQCGLSTLSRPAEDYGLGLTLGNAEARLLELANAYACLARLGQYKPYRLLLNSLVHTGSPNSGSSLARISPAPQILPDQSGLRSSGRSGMSIGSVLGKDQAPAGAACPTPAGEHSYVPLLTELEQRSMSRGSYTHAAPNGALARVRGREMSVPGSRQVADPAAAYLIADMLSDNSARTLAFGAESPLRFNFPVACKTGTSSDFRDNWAFGYTPEFTVGVWVGNFDGTPMEHISGVTGAAPILHDLFEHLRQRYGTSWYAAPANIVECWIHPITGQRLSQAQAASGLEAVRERFLATNLPPVASSVALTTVRLGNEYRDWIASGDNWLGNRAALASGQNSLRILFPLPGTTIYLDPDLPHQGRRLCLRADGSELVEWQSDSLRVARDGNRQVALLTKGRHEITVRDPLRGNTARTWINVLER